MSHAKTPIRCKHAVGTRRKGGARECQWYCANFADLDQGELPSVGHFKAGRGGANHWDTTVPNISHRRAASVCVLNHTDGEADVRGGCHLHAERSNCRDCTMFSDFPSLPHSISQQNERPCSKNSDHDHRNHKLHKHHKNHNKKRRQLARQTEGPIAPRMNGSWQHLSVFVQKASGDEGPGPLVPGHWSE